MAYIVDSIELNHSTHIDNISFIFSPHFFPIKFRINILSKQLSIFHFTLPWVPCPITTIMSVAGNRHSPLCLRTILSLFRLTKGWRRLQRRWRRQRWWWYLCVSFDSQSHKKKARTRAKHFHHQTNNKLKRKKHRKCTIVTKRPLATVMDNTLATFRFSIQNYQLW